MEGTEAGKACLVLEHVGQVKLSLYGLWIGPSCNCILCYGKNNGSWYVTKSDYNLKGGGGLGAAPFWAKFVVPVI